MSTTVSNQERNTMISVTRKLRRAKRQAFLKQVQQPEDNVDHFRQLLLQLATSDDSSLASAATSCNSSTSTWLSSSSSSLDSISEDGADCRHAPEVEFEFGTSRVGVKVPSPS